MTSPLTTRPGSAETFYGIVTFETPIGCISTTLGQKVDVTIGGVAGTLELPGSPKWEGVACDEVMRVPLTAPAAAATWKQGDAPIRWGSPIRYPEGWCRVKNALLTFELPQEKMRELALQVDRGFHRWCELFDDFFELTTKQRRIGDIEFYSYPLSLDLFRWLDGKVFRPHGTDPTPINIHLDISDTHLLRPDQLIEICNFASDGRDAALPYQMQLEAGRALKAGKYRQAVIEAGTAAELGLIQAARTTMAAGSIGFADELIKRFPSLGGKLELARMLGVELPEQDYPTLLVNPRNAAIHRGQAMDRAQAHRALKATDDLLARVCPHLQAPA